MGKTTSAAKRRPRSGLIRRIWIVQRDHSIAGSFLTKREAMAHARLRNHDPQNHGLEPFVVGPYVLQWRKPS